MKYLLDTNICIYFLKGKYDLEKKIAKEGIENCSVSEITLTELVYGAEATAIANNLILVTRNVSEFERLTNIKIENWIDN